MRRVSTPVNHAPKLPIRTVLTSGVWPGGRTVVCLEGSFGRLRDVAVGPDRYVSTNNREHRGSPVAADDRVIGLSPAP